MTCFNPIPVYADVNEYGFVDTKIDFKRQHGVKLYLPCRHCIGCVVQRRATQALLFKMEAATRAGQPSAFITLTYNDDNLPPSGISHLDVSRYLETFKRFLSRHGIKDTDYLVADELGLLNFRPHHHIIFFGADPLDFQYMFGDYCTYMDRHQSSALVARQWKKGYNTVLPCNNRTICYTAGYTAKKIMVVGDMYDVIRKTTELRKRAARSNGLLYERSQKTIDKALSRGVPVKEYVKKHNEELRARIPEFIEWKGRLVENPKFPKGRCFNYRGHYYRCESVRSSCNLGKDYFEKYGCTPTGLIYDPVEPQKIHSIPSKFLKTLADTDFSAYVQIKRFKAHFAEISQKKIEDSVCFQDENENAIRLALKHGNLRPLDMEPLTLEDEEELEKDIF